ncbi:MAG: 1-acyl-sn-glycerol-3-phosphate acyltransferase [Porticoccaceae bacterium]|nr:1-acyl-sn-glycerol-3-phosphate acyltransferase [Porticoccaceae bacterium]
MSIEDKAFNFEEIRPYRDDEIAMVVARLVDDQEFIATLAHMKFPRLMDRLPRLLKPVISRFIHRAVHRVLGREFGHLHSVRQCQELIAEQLGALLDRVADGITVTGLDKLATPLNSSPGSTKAYLFVCNHRDIAMDPAMVNFALNECGMDTTRIAIGDNLLTKPFTSDLMRLNKSFIVKRSATARREKLAALKELSAYIHHSLNVDKQSIWIAQREGRAKDGIDGTETALLKMLVLNKAREQSFGEAFAELHIIPVAISYEWDPCDEAKAKELCALGTEGSYIKAEHEDIDSIYQGIVGEKGHIEVVFGDELTGPYSDAGVAAAAIDRQITANYRLQASHLIAYEQLHGESPNILPWKQALGDVDWAAKRGQLQKRLSNLSAEQKKIMLAAYANPVKCRLEAEGGAHVGLGLGLNGLKA